MIDCLPPGNATSCSSTPSSPSNQAQACSAGIGIVEFREDLEHELQRNRTQHHKSARGCAWPGVAVCRGASPCSPPLLPTTYAPKRDRPAAFRAPKLVDQPHRAKAVSSPARSGPSPRRRTSPTPESQQQASERPSPTSKPPHGPSTTSPTSQLLSRQSNESAPDSRHMTGYPRSPGQTTRRDKPQPASTADPTDRAPTCRSAGVRVNLTASAPGVSTVVLALPPYGPRLYRRTPLGCVDPASAPS